MAYNLLTCSGFTGPSFGGGCTMAWVGLPIVFFFFAFVRKFAEDFFGWEFSFVISLVAAYLGYFIVITIFGAFKIALIVAIIAGLAGGFGLSQFGGEYE